MIDRISLHFYQFFEFTYETIENASMKQVTIYTDGACSGNPGPGGWSAILLFGETKKEISGGFANTTNNRMELLAVINALSHLKETCKVTLFTDSQYIVKAINEGWLEKWKANNWKRNKREMALNIDLWQKLLPLLIKHTIEFRWTRGHANDMLNERCDELAVLASREKNLPEDIRENSEEGTMFPGAL